MSIETDLTLTDVAEALGMSQRWVRQQVQGGAEHQRYGNKIRFTPEQVEKLRERFRTAGPKRSITTGKRRSA